MLLNNFLGNIMDSATYTSLLPLKRLRKTQFYGYAADQYRITPNLTINMGLRYTFFNVYHEVNNLAIPFDFATCGGYCPVGSPFQFPRHADFDPRLGIAWARGKTVLRAGAGIYHSDGQEDDQDLPISNDVERYTLSSVTTPGLSYPIDPFLQNTVGIVTPRAYDRNHKDMYVASWNCIGAANLAGEYRRHGFLCRQQRDTHPDDDVRQHGQPADRRAAISSIWCDPVAGQRQQQHLSRASDERAASLSERMVAGGELYVVAFDQ